MLARGFLKTACRIRYTSTLASLQTALLSQDYAGASAALEELPKEQVETRDQKSALIDSHRLLLEHYKQETNTTNFENLLKMEKKLYELRMAPYTSIVAALGMAIELNEPEKGIELWVSYLEALGSRTLTPIPEVISKNNHLHCSLLALTCYFKACAKGNIPVSTTAASSLVPLNPIPAIARAVTLSPEDLAILENGLKYLRAHRQDFGSPEYIKLVRMATNEEVGILYQEALQRDHVPEEVYAEFIRRFGETRQTAMATKAWNTMVKSGIKPSVVGWNGLLRATVLLKENALENFDAVWTKMVKSGCEPDAQSYGIKIACLGRNKRYAEALELFNSLRQQSGTPHIDIFVVNNMLNCLLQQRLFDSALSLLSWAARNNITPNIVSYNDVLDKALAADVDIADKVFDELRKTGINPDIVTWSQALQHIFKQGRKHRRDVMDRVENIVSAIEASPVTPNAHFLTILADGISKSSSGSIDRIRQLFDRIKATNLRIDIPTFGAFIEAELLHGSVQRALTIFNSIKNYGHPPNVPTYTQMIQGALNRRSPEIALQVWEKLNSKSSVRLNPTVWTFMFILSKAGDSQLQGTAAYRQLLASAIARLAEEKQLVDYRLAANIVRAQEHVDVPQDLAKHAEHVLENDLDLAKARRQR